MARVRQQTWKTVLIVAVIVLALALVFSGYLGWFIGILIILLAMAGGALLNRTLGPPDR